MDVIGIEGEIILWAATLGLLIGVIWTLRYVIKLQRRMAEKLHVDSSLGSKIKKASKPKKKK